MKRSTMIKKALNHTSNTVCVNEEQVEVMLSIFEKLGMLPPYRPNSYGFLDEDDEVILDHSWEPEE
jgi:hypothetical protein